MLEHHRRDGAAASGGGDEHAVDIRVVLRHAQRPTELGNLDGPARSPRDPGGTAALQSGSSRFAFVVALYTFAGLIALFAAKIARDVSRRDSIVGGNGGQAPMVRGSAARAASRNRMMRG